MYPDKLKRFVIDGVADAELYRASSVDTDLVFIDDIVDSLFKHCHQAGPDTCPIYDSNATKIRERYFNVLDHVAQNPVPVPLAEPPLVITRKALVTQLFYATYKPLALFPTVAKTIHAIETNNQTALAALASEIVSPTECECESKDGPTLVHKGEANLVVTCGDGDPYPYNPAEFAQVFSRLSESSALLAPLWADSYLGCADWKITPKWRWTGPLRAANTSHPILLVSTSYDPVCPLTQARAVQKRFGGSVLLTQESHGHCSLSAPSLCTAKYLREYFVDGTLPEEGATCEVDELPFVGRTKATRVLSTDDEELLDAMRGLAEGMPVFARV